MIRIDNTKTNATQAMFTIIDETSQSVIHGCYASCCDTFSDATHVTSHATIREQNNTARLLASALGYRTYSAGKMDDVEEFRNRVEAAR